MSYARKEERFWTDPELRKINYTSRYLFDWFFTNPQRHFSGVYFYEKSIISPQTGIPLKLIDKSTKELEDHGFIRVCRDHSVVFVVNMLKHQTMEKPLSPTQTVGIKSHLKTLHCKCFENEFNNKYSHLFSEKDIPWKKNREPIHTPMDTPIHTPMDTNSHSQLKEPPPTPPNGGNGVVPFLKVQESWNRNAPPLLPRIKVLDEKRKRLIKAAWQEHPELIWFDGFFRDIVLSDHHSGKNDKGWVPDISWILKERVRLQEKFDSLKEAPAPRGVSHKPRSPECPRCHGKGLYRAGEMPDGSPAMKNCDCVGENFG
jgi:hypothetical protein